MHWAEWNSTHPGFRVPTKLDKDTSQDLRRKGQSLNMYLRNLNGCPDPLDNAARWHVTMCGILGSRLMWEISDEFGPSSRKLGHDIVRRAAALCDPIANLLQPAAYVCSALGCPASIFGGRAVL